MKKSLMLLVVAMMLVLAACSGKGTTDKTDDTKDTEKETAVQSGEVNLYTSRHYDVDDDLYKQFEKETGVKVNVIKGDADELLERIKREGTATKADIFLTADVGRLYRAKEDGLLQATSSDIISKQVPANFRDNDDMWIGLTKRARVLVYNKDKVKPETPP